MTYWTLELFRRYHRYFSLRSFWAYRKALIQERQGCLDYDNEVVLEMKWPIRQPILMRPSSNDHYTFLEVFKEEVYAMLCSHTSNVRTIVDLGANIGLASLYLLNKNPGASLIAVEPDPHNYRLLTWNLNASPSRARCQSVQAAVWSQETLLKIVRPGSAGHVNQIRVEPFESQKGDYMPVPGMTIKQIIEKAGFETIDILKVDIEGAEVELFKGNTDWLNRVRWLAIEFHHGSRKESNFDVLMSERGWKILDESAHTVVAGRA